MKQWKKRNRSKPQSITLAGMLVGMLAGFLLLSGCGENDTLSPGDSSSETNISKGQEAPDASPSNTFSASDHPADGSVNAAAKGTALKAGTVLHGFRIEREGKIPSLNASTYSMKHEASGADLLFIQNNDPELTFSIMFRVPQMDETDTAHVFEHSILASSEKYPSKDIFFDMEGKTYNTYLNAYTTSAFTCYPISSQSQEQLEKMADVYMSCMDAPSVLEDENFFKREAIRYVLHDEKDPIVFEGTVYAEDCGRLTSVEDNASDNVYKTLYPSMVASNRIGCINQNYEDVSYQHQLDTYNHFYHYGNSLILLYGDMDYDSMLEFLDSNYLGKNDGRTTAAVKNNNDDMMAAEEILEIYGEEAPKGFVEAEIPVPAYKGDSVENATQIDYAFDLSDFTPEELFELEIIMSMLDSESSPFHTGLRDKGLFTPSASYLINYDGYVKNTAFFTLSQTEPEAAQIFKDVVDEMLKDVEKNGISEKIAEAAFKSKELDDCLMLDDSNIGVSLTTNLGGYWSLTGNTDYFEQMEDAFERLREDNSQERLKSLIGKVRQSARCALVTSTPDEGLAEKIEEQEAEFLRKKKESMSSEELKDLIAETTAFDEWNASELTNNSFMIPVQDLPDPELPPEVSVTTGDGMTQLSVATEIQKAGSYGICFDTSSLLEEDFYDLMLYQLLVGKLRTGKYTKEDLSIQIELYLPGFNFSNIYPETRSSFHYPMMIAVWEGMTEDYPSSLSLLMEILRYTDFSDGDEAAGVIEEYKESFNMGRHDTGSEALSLGLAYVNTNAAYQYRLTDAGFYSYMQKEQWRLADNPEYASIFSERMQSVADRILTRGRLVTLTAAGKDAIPRIQECNTETFSKLSKARPGYAEYFNPYTEGDRIGTYMDSSMQSSYFLSRISTSSTFMGRYIPYLCLLSSNYLVPELRFKGGVYSAGAGAWTSADLIYAYSSSDPNTKKTLDIYSGMPDILRNMKVTAEELDGAILKAYSDATLPVGVLSRANAAMIHYLGGWDTNMEYDLITDIRNAGEVSVEDAAHSMEEMLNEGVIVMAGNESKMRPDADAFDIIYDYR